ncbi:MAG: hypothetical protein HY709_00955 [Candidatus Latescibacteria bacterium]|nr:hypothetical protein [Candidatus Latescibacterota bacterium]
MASNQVTPSSLHQFFGNLTRRSFAELWIWDEAVIDYLAEMLTRFARSENLYRIKRSTGERLETIVEMLIEVNRPLDLQGCSDRSPIWERTVRQHIGDYTMFMAGIFRENVERRGILGYYLREGQRAYLAVSELDRLLYRPGADLFKKLSRDFEYLTGALTYMKKVHFRSAASGGPYQDIFGA